MSKGRQPTRYTGLVNPSPHLQNLSRHSDADSGSHFDFIFHLPLKRSVPGCFSPSRLYVVIGMRWHRKLMKSEAEDARFVAVVREYFPSTLRCICGMGPFATCGAFRAMSIHTLCLNYCFTVMDCIYEEFVSRSL